MVILLCRGFVLEFLLDSFRLFLAFLPDHIRRIGFHCWISPLLKHELVVLPSGRTCLSRPPHVFYAAD